MIRNGEILMRNHVTLTKTVGGISSLGECTAADNWSAVPKLPGGLPHVFVRTHRCSSLFCMRWEDTTAAAQKSLNTRISLFCTLPLRGSKIVIRSSPFLDNWHCRGKRGG